MTVSGAEAVRSIENRAPGWLVALGSGFIVFGGLVAAVTGPLELYRGSWLAAYLVLVCGVAQYAMGRADARLGLASTSMVGRAKVVGWNVGNAAVIAGTFAASPFVVDAGGLVLLLVVVGCLYDLSRQPAPTGGTGVAEDLRARRLIRWVYAVMLLVVAVSIPVGLLLSHLRHG